MRFERDHPWQGWSVNPTKECLVNDKVTGGVLHILVAQLGERSPDDNHVHVKFIKGEFVFCSFVENGERVHTRGAFCDRINSATGLDIKF